MGDSEAEINLCSIGEPKLHGGMCKILSNIYVKVLGIFPDLEAARPRSTTGIQALCALHIALEKTKNILQHCAECSKLYLAITGDSVVLKLERARSALQNGLRRVEDIVPQTIGCQISKILSELDGIEFSIDPAEKQVGDDIIALLQQGRKFNSKENDNNELETFHQSASRLGISSSRAILRERRALRKLIERAQADEDKRKESIVAYLMHLLSKYSKLFRTEVSDDNDSQCSTPCSPTIQGFLEGHAHSFDHQPLSKPNSFNFKPNFGRSDQIPIPPEELRCPISLQLMYDPVIIASGQTYERICIEKWFDDGHKTCPKTQQELPHLDLTCNYCVKGLVGSWCEQNGLPIPDGPPESLDLNYWRLAFSENESSNSISGESIGSCKLKADKEYECQCNAFERYDDILTTLKHEVHLTEKCKAVEQIRNMVKDDVEVRIYMGANGFIEALMLFLESAIEARNGMAQEIGAMALFNLGVDNNRNKGMMLAAGVLSLLEKMIAANSPTSVPPSTALCLNLSCHEEAKLVIGTSKVLVPFLIRVLHRETTGPTQCQLDALHALFNLSTNPANIPHLMSSGIIDGLLPVLSHSGDCSWVEKCVAIIINLASSTPATDEIISKPGLISGLSSILDSGGPTEQEQAAACLVMLCSKNEKCCEMVLQEGVVPSLVSISVNGTVRGKQKAQRLLMLFRDQRHRQKEPPRGAVISTQPPPPPESNYPAKPGDTPNPLCKSTSKRKLGKALSFLWKNKSFSVYQC